MSKIVFFSAAVLLILAGASFAQNDTSTAGGSGAASPFSASDSLKNFATESLQAAVKNISHSISAGNVDAAAFWWANDSQTIIQNLTLNLDQILALNRRTQSLT
jgi:hypothetical protein